MKQKEIEETLDKVDMDKDLREAVKGWIRLAYQSGWEEGLRMGQSVMGEMFSQLFNPKGGRK